LIKRKASALRAEGRSQKKVQTLPASGANGHWMTGRKLDFTRLLANAKPAKFLMDI
jgi:hypothetical protein